MIENSFLQNSDIIFSENRMKTKEKILQTALEQFNKNGSSKITTNHIAETMGISPGNLYYHYRNKEAIVLKLWENMIDEINIPFYDEPSQEQGVQFIHFLYEFFGVVYKYRFFWLEMAVLLGKDPVLKQKYTNRTRNLLKIYKENVYNWYKVGMLLPSLDKEDLDQLIENTFFLTQFWALHTYIHEDKITPENLLKGAGRIIKSIKPHLTSETLELVETTAAKLKL